MCLWKIKWWEGEISNANWVLCGTPTFVPFIAKQCVKQLFILSLAITINKKYFYKIPQKWIRSPLPQQFLELIKIVVLRLQT